MNGIRDSGSLATRHPTSILFCMLAVSGAIALNGLPLERCNQTATALKSPSPPLFRHESRRCRKSGDPPDPRADAGSAGVREVSSISRTSSFQPA
ncbi:MAG: hypothetical protein IPL99_04330 [Candidatus Competibacteraceae bacterium]|nr:hypothetical protein [Candidatus Competibacteraceae bacterium]